jgi:hypothetical protein
MEGESSVLFNYTVSFSDIQIGKQNNTPEEILDVNFDRNISEVMQNENNPKVVSKGMYWDGKRMIFENPPEKYLVAPQKVVFKFIT